MKLTEALVWQRYLKPALLRGFRVESSTYTGIPDVFGILPDGRAVWIENKIVPSEGSDLLNYLRPGQSTFRKEYSPSIPVIVLGAVRPGKSPYSIFVANVAYANKSPRTFVARCDNYPTACQKIINDIAMELNQWH